MAQLYLTGGVRLDGPTGSFTEADLPGNQGRLVLVVLAVERRPISRDELADIVWGEHPPDQWSGALAAIVSKLRTLLTTCGLDGHDVVSSVGGTYSLELPPDAWVDWEAAIRRVDRAEGAARHDRHADAVVDATVASSILRRPMLTGIDCSWADAVRRRHADLRYRCLTALAASWIELGDHQLAATVAESAVQFEPFRETAHRLLIEADAARGDRAAALTALARFERVMREELGIEPSPETVELGRRLRR